MIAVIDYGAGNLRNVCKALEHVGASFVLTDDVGELRRADKLVLPGVGAFADCLNGLHSRKLFDPIREMALAGKPLLGICVGMQLLFDVGEEMGQWPGLGLIGGRVVKFDFSRLATEVAPGEPAAEGPPTRTHERIGADQHSAESPPAVISIAGRLKIPHIGWNNITPNAAHPIFTGIERGGYAYFVHSFHAVVTNPAHAIGLTEYGYDFASVVAKDNIWGAQFHPEKSQEIGLAMLRNFSNYS
ncbi:MAG TPA: imidazole glycerol phosphate synthase subunit HisH [Thermoflexales bacterium]|nr:imidazole glycerol phosphate synthase subunit HisH [Thermoflexales bacterium]